MHSTGLARTQRPLQRALPDSGSPAPEARSAVRPPRPSSYADFGRVLRWSLLLSAALHALLLVVSPSFVRVGPPPGATDTRYQPREAARVAQLVNPVVSDAAAEPDPAAADDPRAPAQTAPQPERALVPVPTPGAAAEPPPPASASTTRSAGTASDALAPGYRDPRLWVNPRDPSAQPQKSDHQRYMEHLQARIDAQNDSLYGRGPNTDWTVKDKEGRRWGISEEGLHLGGLTIPPYLLPLPAATGDNQSIEAAREEQRQRDEIRRQEEAGERQRTQEERARATRERKDGERKTGGGGG